MSDEMNDDYLVIIVNDEYDNDGGKEVPIKQEIEEYITYSGTRKVGIQDGEYFEDADRNIKQEIGEYPTYSGHRLDFDTIQNYLNSNMKQEDENSVPEEEGEVEDLEEEYNYIGQEDEDFIQDNENSVPEYETFEEETDHIPPQEFENKSKKKRKIEDIEYLSPDEFESPTKSNEEVIEEENDNENTSNKKDKKNLRRTFRYRWRRPDPSTWTSKVQVLREDNPNMNEEDIIKAIAIEMMNLEAPPLPKNAYIELKEGFKCTICKKTKKFKGHIERHWQTYHGTRYCVCYSCGADYRCKNALYRHEKRCKAMGASLVLKARAIQVASQQKPRNGIIPDIKVPAKKYYCSYCPEFFTLKAALVCHTKKHKPKDGTVEPSFVHLQDKEYKCTLCRFSYDEEKDLILHHRMHVLGRPFQCVICPRAYKSKPALDKHSLSHKNVSYECNLCNRLFKHKKGVQAHMDTHEEPKYQCQECPKRYCYNAALQIHIARKHRCLPSSFVCEICFKGLSRMSNLQSHMMKMHGVVLMSKEAFIKRLPNMTEEEMSEIRIFDPAQSYAPSDLFKMEEDAKLVTEELQDTTSE